MASALIDSIAESGFHATRVADVIAGAGLSRKTFYKHFPNKEACLLATFDIVSDDGIRRAKEAYRQVVGRPTQVEAVIRALFESAIENPGALRLSLQEICALGQVGIEARERSIERYEEVIREAMEVAPRKDAVVGLQLKAVLGGLNRVLYRGVLAGKRSELLNLTSDLAGWACSYHATPAAMHLQRAPLEPRVSSRRLALQEGRAPGTLAPHTRLVRRRGLPRGDQNISRSFVEHNQRERILDAVANLTTAEGYAALSVDALAEDAAVSLNAFYEHFTDKEEAFLVAYEVGSSKALAIVERAYAAESDWWLGVRAGLEALFHFLASEASFARMALVDASVATIRTAERSEVTVSAFARMLSSHSQEVAMGKLPPNVTIEAIAGGVFELCLHYALQGRIRELPELTPTATYFALAPFLGGERAARIATNTSPTKIC